MISSTKNVQGGGEMGYKYLIGSPPDVDESDEERELTNLNWLLRNQNVTWPEIIDGNSNDNINANGLSPTSKRRMVGESKIANINLCANQKLNIHKENQVFTSNSNVIRCSHTRKQNSPTVASLKRLSPAERFEIFINKIKRDLAEYEKSAIKYTTDVTEKPPFNYSHIIGMAMLDYGRATLQQICAWIESKFAFFRVRKKWNNSIRHNLSLHHCFRNRKREEKGKGGYWELGVDPKKCDRKRIRNRKPGQSKPMSSLQLAKNNSPQKTQTNVKCTKKGGESIQMCLPNETQHAQSYSYIAADNIKELNLVDKQATVSDGSNALELSFPFTARQNIYRPLCSNESPMSINADELQDQYERGTIIIRRSGDTLCLNDIFINKFNNINMIYSQDEIPTLSENVIISSQMSAVLDVNKDSTITPAISLPEISNVLPTNCDYSSFRSYINGEDDSFNYIHSTELNRNEDILSNLLDLCVRDF
ncbi:forkhead box protein N4 isoform X2 [Drosophila nasuta]|uniref:forkhead box protein N4 isoform X2 n=1 Tax=Drosophila nasuta TaxID=42062 RepID=UPI00295E8858|nr:forkhead box protein N4 isoform X2 [Drosophila nasuta]XP_060661068.1 forkhead box protein N4 isoform X2 [Drosophila nasuta]